MKKTSASGFVLLILGISYVSHTASAEECWIGTWASGQQLTESQNNPPSPGIANNTLRQVVHATLGGSRIRVQFSNKYSSGAVTINSAHIAATAGGCGHWTLNDNDANTTVLDSSGNNHHGTAVQNTSVLHTDSNNPPYLNGALTFNGTSDYVNLGTGVIGTGAYTKVAWVRREAGATGYNIISGNAYHALWAPNFSGYMYGYRLTAGHNDIYNQIQDPVPLDVNTWYMVALTYEPNATTGRFVLYKNGAEVNEVNNIPRPTAASTTYIGRYSTAYYFKGAIDNAMIFNRALTAEEIAALYNNGNGTENISEGPHQASYTANGAIITSTDTALSFGGSSSVTISAGQEVYSDALDFNVTPLSNLTVSIYFGAASSTSVTGHPGSRTTSYIQTGNTVSADNMDSAPGKPEHWYILSRIDLWLDDSYGCVVTLGDSITDGRGSTTNGNNRWPDNLASRLAADPSTAKVGVINQGIGGNTVVSGGLGPTALVRFDHDVIGQPGVRWVIILEGVNDIGGGQSASSLISAYQQLINKAHAANILAYGVPILPFGGSSYDSTAHRAVRDTVNNWIRTSGQFDAVIDLDAAVRDPEDPEKLLAAYDSGDHLHLSVAGYQKMADSIDLYLFKNTADLYNDGIVDFVDFAILGGQWRQEPGLPSADIAPPEGDGAVDLDDFYAMAQEWLKER